MFSNEEEAKSYPYLVLALNPVNLYSIDLGWSFSGPMETMRLGTMETTMETMETMRLGTMRRSIRHWQFE